MVKSDYKIAPIAQWIERCPPEAETRVRITVGAPGNYGNRLSLSSGGFYLFDKINEKRLSEKIEYIKND